MSQSPSESDEELPDHALEFVDVMAGFEAMQIAHVERWREQKAIQDLLADLPDPTKSESRNLEPGGEDSA